MEETATIFKMLDADELIITGADVLSVVATEEAEVLELIVGITLGVESEGAIDGNRVGRTVDGAVLVIMVGDPDDDNTGDPDDDNEGDPDDDNVGDSEGDNMGDPEGDNVGDRVDNNVGGIVGTELAALVLGATVGLAINTGKTITSTKVRL
jgi:hypothetical protein